MSFLDNLVIVVCFAFVSLKSSVKIQSVWSISIISKQIKALPKTIETNQLTASLLVKQIPHDKKKEKDISEKQLFEYVRISFIFYAFSRNLHLLDFQYAKLLFVENFLKFKLQTNDDRTKFPSQKHSRSPERGKKSVKVSKNPQQTRGQHLKPQKYTK